MPQPKLDLWEQHAVKEAGNEAGAYLDELGNTDLAAMTAEQYIEFCRRIVVGFENSLRAKILSGTAPF